MGGVGWIEMKRVSSLGFCMARVSTFRVSSSDQCDVLKLFSGSSVYVVAA